MRKLNAALMKNTHNASGHHIVKRDRCRKGKPAINKLMRGPLAAFFVKRNANHPARVWRNTIFFQRLTVTIKAFLTIDNWQVRYYATYLAFLEHFGRNEETFQKILINKELLKTLLNNFNNIEKEVWVYDTDLKSFTTREVDLLDYDLPSAIATLLGKVEGAIYAQRSTQLSATLLGIDPVIYSNHMFLHEWTTEQLVKDYGKLNPLSSEEQAITMGLSAAEVKFLTALSDLELKKIRERGQLESLRHELRISRHDLQGKTPDQMQDAANNFSKHLINVVEEYGKSHESAIKNSKKKKVSSGLIFAGTATLGIASLAMPQLTLLSAAATGIGLAFGGKSLADIFSEHKAHKNEIQMLEKTPVSLLYGAYKKK